jgi:hypothetical protein
MPKTFVESKQGFPRGVSLMGHGYGQTTANFTIWKVCVETTMGASSSFYSTIP